MAVRNIPLSRLYQTKFRSVRTTCGWDTEWPGISAALPAKAVRFLPWVSFSFVVKSGCADALVGEDVSWKVLAVLFSNPVGCISCGALDGDDNCAAVRFLEKGRNGERRNSLVDSSVELAVFLGTEV